MHINQQVKHVSLALALFYALSLCLGCKKYLDKKVSKNYVIPSTLKDLQGLMDDYNFINYQLPSGGGEVSATEYYLNDADVSGLREDLRNMYLWNDENQFQLGSNDWSQAYKIIYISNTVLETLNKIQRTSVNGNDWDNIKGQALFLRALYYHAVAIVWANGYSSATASTDLGIPLRLNTNFNEISTRDNLQKTYNLIINDLKEASRLLPVTPLHVLRSSKPAAFALLSRVYLSMNDYNDAEIYADSTLKLFNTVLDYNSGVVVPSSTSPFTLFNEEIIYQARMTFLSPLSGSRAKIDSNLYKLYDTNDLRKTVFFRDNGNGTYRFKGSYDPGNLFAGIASDEVYLTRAECYARNNKLTEALKDLNTLLIKRYKTGSFTSITASNSTEALDLILKERRKELLMRGIRWMDIKRLNKAGAGIILTRKNNGITYTLKPNDLRYALLIPEDVIAISGMQQNER
jgi:hypothetical protein